MQIGIVSGELSGDVLGSGLMRALEAREPGVHYSGIGGPQMIAEGFASLYEQERLSVMGLVEPLKRLPELWGIRRGLYQHFVQQRPEVFIGIDSPDFNLGLEKRLRQQDIPVVHYVSPSVWAWRVYRVHAIRRSVDMMLTLFPFEADFFERHHVPTRFVGHPLADQIPLHSDKKAARLSLGLDPDALIVALLPGSRGNELRYLGETFLQTAQYCLGVKPGLQFITSAANAVRDTEFKAIAERVAPDLPLKTYVQQTQAVMAAADVVLVTSGTATLETMLIKRPMVIAYRMAPVTFQIARHLVKTSFIGLPNILAKEALIPEFIQHQATPEALGCAVLQWLEQPDKCEALVEKFTEIHTVLRCDANVCAAEAVRALIR